MWQCQRQCQKCLIDMATSRKYRKSDYLCNVCGKSIESWTRTQQDEHKEMHRLEAIEKSKQTTLF